MPSWPPAIPPNHPVARRAGRRPHHVVPTGPTPGPPTTTPDPSPTTAFPVGPNGGDPAHPREPPHRTPNKANSAIASHTHPNPERLAPPNPSHRRWAQHRNEPGGDTTPRSRVSRRNPEPHPPNPEPPAVRQPQARLVVTRRHPARIGTRTTWPRHRLRYRLLVCEPGVRGEGQLRTLGIRTPVSSFGPLGRGGRLITRR